MTTKEKLEEIISDVVGDDKAMLLQEVCKRAYNLAIQDAADEAETDYDMANVNKSSITKLMIK